MTLYLIAAILTGLIGSIAAIWHAGYRAGVVSEQSRNAQYKQKEMYDELQHQKAMEAEVMRPRDASVTTDRLRTARF